MNWSETEPPLLIASKTSEVLEPLAARRRSRTQPGCARVRVPRDSGNGSASSLLDPLLANGRSRRRAADAAAGQLCRHLPPLFGHCRSCTPASTLHLDIANGNPHMNTPAAAVSFRCEWWGLTGRVVADLTALWGVGHSRVSQADHRASSGAWPVGSLNSNLSEIVATLGSPWLGHSISGVLSRLNG
jgi:hypothetical protein